MTPTDRPPAYATGEKERHGPVTPPSLGRDPASNGVEQLEPFTDRNVIAVFDRAEDAQSAMAAAERHHIDGQQLSFASGHGGRSMADERFAVKARKWLILGGIYGVIGGLVLGVMVALVLDATIDADTDAVWASSLFGFAAFGAAVGAFYRMFASTAASEAWREAFAADPEGTSRVIVHLGRDDDLEEIRELLHRQGPQDVRVVDRRGRRVDAASG